VFRVRIVLVHGFLDSAATWDDTVAALGGASDRVVALDLAGMGARVAEPGPYTLARYATEVGVTLGELDGPVLLVGHSMGAQVAELTAVGRPERVAGLVLVTPVPLAGARLPAEQTESFRTLGGQRQRQRASRAQLSVALLPKRMDQLVDAGARVAPDVVAAVVDAWNGGDPAGLKRTAFTGPVLIVRGAGDPFVTEEVLNAGVLPRFPGARLVTVAGAGHWPHVEQPAAVAALLEEFLTTLPGGAATGEADGGCSTGSSGGSSGGSENSWRGAFSSKSDADFAAAFAPEVTLRARTLVSPVRGRVAVTQVMAAASGIYQELEFTHQARSGARTYLEWRAVAFGGVELAGITVLVEDADGRIVDVAIHHRPLNGVLRFSAELRDRVGRVVDPAHFYPGELRD
jgi:pimeloyl-ACP methyl ester carboxylesterase